jgi:hypothetical protein
LIYYVAEKKAGILHAVHLGEEEARNTKENVTIIPSSHYSAQGGQLG